MTTDIVWFKILRSSLTIPFVIFSMTMSNVKFYRLKQYRPYISSGQITPASPAPSLLPEHLYLEGILARTLTQIYNYFYHSYPADRVKAFDVLTFKYRISGNNNNFQNNISKSKKCSIIENITSTYFCCRTDYSGFTQSQHPIWTDSGEYFQWGKGADYEAQCDSDLALPFLDSKITQ